jgi:serine/threonine-protein kinase
MIRDSVIDWQELSALYEQAEGLDESGREAFLAPLRAQKHRLLGQLERMLQARDRIATSTFLESLPRLEPAPEPAPSDLGEGSRVGAYRLIRPIGSGGMAEVWLAERADGAFDRQVAIKLLFNQPTRSQREGFVARFERERDILASLHHPHIAGLHDAGVTARGEPWLALEYVQGDPITAWCDKRQLALRERVQVFRQVLVAVEHAHANLIIHRDLKPSNILVTDEGEVKLLDFGIAKLMQPDGGQPGASDLTREGGRPLTLQYASPEQLSGRPLTTASDVYSLGVVLYEMLCGARPFDVAHPHSAAQLESAILAGDVAPPSRRVTDASATSRGSGRKALVRALAGDLDAVAAKALHGETARRYPSVEALRLDLERWCEGRPVDAQPASVAYRAGKFYLRHRLGVWSGGLAISSILVLGIAAVVAGLKAQSESARAIASRDFVVDLFRMADPENSRGRDMSPRALLEAGRKRALDAFAKQPALQADVLRQIGVMQIYVGDYKGADETLSQAVSMFARQGPVRDWVLTQIEIAENANYLGDVKRAEQMIASTSPSIEAFAEDAALMAKYWQVKGFISRARRDHTSAAEELGRAVVLSTQVHGADHVDTIDAIRDLAATYGESGRFDEAYALLEDASGRSRRNPAVGRRDMLALDADMILTAIKAGRYEVTAAPLRRLLVRCDAELGVDADHCVILVERLAWLSLRLDDAQTSRALIPRLLATAGNDASPLQQAASANIAAEVLANEGRLQEHSGLLEQLRRTAASDQLPPRIRSQALLALALAALRTGNVAAAIMDSQAARDIQESSSHPDLDMLAKARLVRGLARQREAALEPALADIDGAVADLGRAMGADHPLVALYRCNRSVVLRDLGRRQEAAQSLESSLRIVSRGFGDSQVVHRLQTLLAELRVERQNSPPQADASAPFL